MVSGLLVGTLFGGLLLRALVPSADQPPPPGEHARLLQPPHDAPPGIRPIRNISAEPSLHQPSPWEAFMDSNPSAGLWTEEAALTRIISGQDPGK